MSKLGDALKQASLPESDGRERAVAAVSEPGSGPSGVAKDQTSPGNRRLPIWAVATLLAGGVAVLVGLSFTPPGRAVAGDIGRLVGIGGEPTNPPVLGERAVVIGSGDAARSFPFEIVASTNHDGQPNEEACVGVDFPGVEPRITSANCLTASRISLETYAENPSVYPAPRAFAPDGEVIVQGMIPVGAEVTIGYTMADGAPGTATVHTSELTDELGEQIDVAGRASFFLTVLPSGILRGGPEDPGVLTCASVTESLSRVDYRVVAVDGETVVDSTLGDIDPATSLSTLGSLLLSRPPAGFTSEYDRYDIPACSSELPRIDLR